LAIGKAVQAAKKVLDKEFSPDAYNIGINNGLMAGQSVMHLHVHIIPRYKGDVENPKGGVRWVLRDKANYWDNK
jgi:diadenosine tetraphosphate (Ap4A) HIT family hydrolase